MRISPKVLQQSVLATLLVLEIIVFSIIGTNFLTIGNFLKIANWGTELGLVSLAMTTVIVTGGIDLSVGSLLGLSAVVFGKLWRDAHFPWPLAAAAAIIVGLIGGAINAGAIARFRIHPLIATLATFSLYRGIAEGLTSGSDNFTHFPASFQQLGNFYIAIPVLIVGVIGFYLLLHRSTLGRELSAIGYAPEGARYGGIPVEKRIAVPYLLSGLMASVAAIIYAAHVDQIKADAGTDFELAAITAVVLGGTSIFGGRATIVGTMLGWCAIRVLENGRGLTDLPSLGLKQLPAQLTGIATSVLLLLAIGMDHHLRRPPKSAVVKSGNQEFSMKNSQLAVLCTVILAAALISLAGSYVLVNAISKQSSTVHVVVDRGAGDLHTAPSSNGGSAQGVPVPTGTGPAAHKITIGMMPKSVGNAYFIACRKGAEEAANELGDTLLWDGPTGAEPGKQNEIVETWITRHVDVIAVSADNAAGISTALRDARAKGIKVVTWDADAEPDARDYFVNQATPQGIGTALMDNAAKVMGGKGNFAIITASLTASNQNEWMKYIEIERAAKYPDIHMKVVRPCDDLQPKAFDEAEAIMNSNPDVTLILAISSAAVPGAAEAVKQSGRTDVHVVGLGLPNDNKKYVHAGITPAVILWNTMDLGYLAVYTSQAAADGTLKAGATALNAGRLGQMQVDGTKVLLGVPFVFNKDNIDGFDF